MSQIAIQLNSIWPNTYKAGQTESNNIRTDTIQLETFTKLKGFVDNPLYQEQRKAYLGKLNISTVDTPIVEIIKDFTKLPYCFTLQSCFGHFLHSNQKNSHNIDPLPISDSISSVEYRIVYISLCIENSDLGKALFQGLKEIPRIDSNYIQFGCADWFWQRQVNSYVLQVEPKQQMNKDQAIVDYQ